MDLNFLATNLRGNPANSLVKEFQMKTKWKCAKKFTHAYTHPNTQHMHVQTVIFLSLTST